MTEQERRPDHTKAIKSPGASEGEEVFKAVCFVVLTQRVPMHKHLPAQEQQGQRRKEGGDGLSLLKLAYRSLKSKRRHVLTPAFAQHATVHYSTNLSAPSAESSSWHRRRVPKPFTVIFDVWEHEWLIDCKRVFEQYTLICMRKGFKWGRMKLCALEW